MEEGDGQPPIAFATSGMHVMQRAITLWKPADPMSNVQDRVVACLHAMFDEVLAERIPEQLSSLLDELERAEGAERKAGDEVHSVTAAKNNSGELQAVRK